MFCSVTSHPPFLACPHPSIAYAKSIKLVKPGADDRNDIVFVSFLLRFCFVLGKAVYRR